MTNTATAIHIYEYVPPNTQSTHPSHFIFSFLVCPVLWILCDTLARWLEAVSSTSVEMVTRARKLPGRQEVPPCCGEDDVHIEHWRLDGQHTQR